jgi:hypothetical protein
MIKDYVILYQPVTVNSVVKPKYNIYYYIDGVQDGPEQFHSIDGVTAQIQIREGFINRNRVKWVEMFDALISSATIITKMRTAANMSSNLACVFALMNLGVSGYAHEADLQTLLRLAGWGFTNVEKTTINTYFTNNGFSISV